MNDKPFQCQTAEETAQTLETDKVKGLTSEEAKKRLAEQGPNRLNAKKPKTFFQKFLAQFKDVMIMILLAAAAVSFAVAIYEGDSGEFFEPVLILLIVVLNAVLGVMQESKAEKALEALKDMSAPHARVIRDGHENVIDAYDLVPGDVILLEAGDFVPADARLISASGLKSEESALTGESVPADKDSNVTVEADAPIGNRENMVFTGCSITYGRAQAIVTATGMKTEMGKIANLLEDSGDTMTPLQKKLASLGKYLGFVALGACAVIFIIGLIAKIPLLEMFMTSVSLAVSAIPEGLPAIVTVILSIGVQRMVKRNAIIRKLSAVETLGSASIICSDKTGTLTQNKMTLISAYKDGSEPEKISDSNSDDIKSILTLGILCCDGTVEEKDGKEVLLGDPTETSIISAGIRNKILKADINEKYPRLAEIPFDSDRKLMTTINRIGGKNIVIVKGAFDVLADRCVSGDIEKAKKITESMSAEALRVIAIATREIDAVPDELIPEQIESGLTLAGLVGMIDPPRQEAKDAVALCCKAGIKPVMITGDHVITAVAIAKEIGIYHDGDEAVTGSELMKMSDEELKNRVRKISVYARVSPEDKIRIVKAWQSLGEVVSMTGDGVNDAPALKAADIGCAMGITGTDVAKGAADMTLTDDNFATIVKAVEEGRGVYDNIKKVVGFLLGTNIGEVLTVFISMLAWQISPFLSMQLLWINLVTDSLPAIALGMEAVESDVMDRKPKPKSEGIFANGFGLRTILQGVMFAALTLIAFYIGWNGTGDTAVGTTMAFLTLALSQVVHAFNMRSNHSLFKIGPFTNKYLNGAALISIAMVLIVALIPPLASIFALTQLTLAQYGIVLGLILVPVVVLEISKAFGLVKHEGHHK